VVINANFDVHYTMDGPTRALSQVYSTRIAEVQNSDKPNERELPVGNDHGYLWRLDNYWCIEEKDGGTYVQVESVGLSRSIPAIFAWLINPLIRNIPRAVLSDLLNATRRAVTSSKSAAGWTHPPALQRRNLATPTFGCGRDVGTTRWGSLQFGSVEMPTLEQGDGHFKHLGLTSVECEFPSALWHRTGGTKPILITTNITTNVSSHFPLNDNPSPTAGTCHARAQNAVRHSLIIGPTLTCLL